MPLLRKATIDLSPIAAETVVISDEVMGGGGNELDAISEFSNTPISDNRNSNIDFYSYLFSISIYEIRYQCRLLNIRCRV